jgi:hypothetical protein
MSAVDRTSSETMNVIIPGALVWEVRQHLQEYTCTQT